MTAEVPPGAAARARAWRDATYVAVCDVLQPWAHGIVARATRFPDYYDFNVVRVEGDPGMTAAALEAVADEALAGLAHRRLDFDDADAGEALRPELEKRGFKAMRLVWMRHGGAPPERVARAATVEEVDYDDVLPLRVAWHAEDFPGQDPGHYQAHAREVALRRGAQVLAVREDDDLVAFAQLERVGSGAEITQVYVHPDHRGGGRGTSLTVAAVQAAGDVADLWIVADDEDRPKELYARLGFRPVWTSIQFQRAPRAAAP